MTKRSAKADGGASPRQVLLVLLFSFFLFLIQNLKRQPDQRPCFCAQRSGAFGVKEQPCAKKSFFGIYPLIFSAGRATISVVSSCKSDDADKLSSRLHDAERAAPQGRCKQPVMCRSSTTAERRGEPLPGAPVTAQRVARRGVQFGWNRGTFLIFSGASSREQVCGMKRFFVLLYLSKEQTL